MTTLPFASPPAPWRPTTHASPALPRTRTDTPGRLSSCLGQPGSHPTTQPPSSTPLDRPQPTTRPHPSSGPRRHRLPKPAAARPCADYPARHQPSPRSPLPTSPPAARPRRSAPARRSARPVPVRLPPSALACSCHALPTPCRHPIAAQLAPALVNPHRLSTPPPVMPDPRRLAIPCLPPTPHAHTDYPTPPVTPPTPATTHAHSTRRRPCPRDMPCLSPAALVIRAPAPTALPQPRRLRSCPGPTRLSGPSLPFPAATQALASPPDDPVLRTPPHAGPARSSPVRLPGPSRRTPVQPVPKPRSDRPSPDQPDHRSARVLPDGPSQCSPRRPAPTLRCPPPTTQRAPSRHYPPYRLSREDKANVSVR